MQDANEGNGCNSNSDCCSTDSKSECKKDADKKRSKLDDLGQITLA